MNRRAARTKVQSHLERKGDTYVLDLSETFVLYWWRVLNAALFDDVLRVPKNIVVKSFRDQWASCISDREYSKYSPITIELDADICDREFFIEILAHEMVHQYQQQTTGRMSHGKTFMSWKDKFDILGIHLEKGY